MGVDILPDSRTRDRTGAIQTKAGWFIPVYCNNCHKPWGMVPEKHITCVFVLCNDCYDKHGAPAHLYMEPDQVFWKRVREAMLDEKIDSLTEREMQQRANDPSSTIGKLLKERYTVLEREK